MSSRIPQQFIDDLLDRTDIVEIVDTRVTLRKSGRNYSGLCPFHSEKTPSFSVSPDKQFYYCFGCGAGGNAIGFLMEFDHLDFRAAVDDLARRAGMEVPQEAAGREDPEQQRQQKRLLEHLKNASLWYQRQLREHPQRQRAVDYLKARGLTGEIAKTFGIGYAPAGWHNLVRGLEASPQDEQQLIDAGLLIQKEQGGTDKVETYDRFRDRIIFPIQDSRGRTIAFGGRVLGDEKPKYLNSPETPVFSKGKELYGFYEARQANNRLSRFLIVEGYMDVVALAQHEVLNAVATLGTATSRDHLIKLFRTVPEVVFCFDGDQAGRQAAERALDTSLPIMEDGRQIRFMFLPEGDDPDSLVRKEGKAAFLARIERSLPLSDYFFERMRQQGDANSVEGKARISKLALAKLQSMPQGVLRQLMLEELAALTQMPLHRLLQVAAKESLPPLDAYEQEAQRQGERNEAPRNAMRPRLRRGHQPVRTPVEWATLALLHYPQFQEHLAAAPELLALELQGMELLRAIVTLLQEKPESTPGQVIGHWQTENDQERAEQVARLAAIELTLKDEESLRNEFLNALELLKVAAREQALERLLDKLKQGVLNASEKLEMEQLLAHKHRLSK